MGNLLVTRRGQKYITDRKTLHTKDGMLALDKPKPGKPIKTNTGKLFYVLAPTEHDLFLNSKRGPAVVLPKDFGAIITHTGVNHESTCIDAGTGSGWLAIQLARICKQVTTYENRPEHAAVAAENIKSLGIKNVTLKRKDATKGFAERNVDLITLDLLNPEKVPFARSLKLGGYLVAYLPHMQQVKQFKESLASDLIITKIIDIREEEYLPHNLKFNKKNRIKHTAYLVFARKVSD